MSKKLPFFKFFTGEWLSGDITLLDYHDQGVFINLCAYYWHRECDVNYLQSCRKFNEKDIKTLINEGLISFDYEEDPNSMLTIKFLDEQYEEMATRKKQLSEAGKKGQRLKQAKAQNNVILSLPKTTLKQLEKEKDKEEEKEKKKKISIIKRKTNFLDKINLYKNEYSKDMIIEFFEYWSEHGEEDRKMRFEKQTSFSIKRRLTTWKNNSKKYGPKNNTTGNKNARSTQSQRQNFEA